MNKGPTSHCEAIGGVHCDARVDKWLTKDEGERGECVCG